MEDKRIQYIEGAYYITYLSNKMAAASTDVVIIALRSWNWESKIRKRFGVLDTTIAYPQLALIYAIQ